MDRTVLIFGGTGAVGEGLVKSFLSQNFSVIVPARTQDKIKALQNHVNEVRTGQLEFVIGSLETEEAAFALQTIIKAKTEKIDIIVAAIGGWHQGYPISQYPFSQWQRILQDNLTTHFLAIKIGLPLLNPERAFYIHINGFSAEENYPMAGPVSMAAAAQKSLIGTLAKEQEKTAIAVKELILGPVNTRSRIQRNHLNQNWYSPEEIGDYIIEKIVGTEQSPFLHYLLQKK